MFRQAARRCGRPASTIAAPSMALRSRALLPSIRLAAASTARSGVPFRTFAFSARAYSSEAVAAKEAAPAEEEITKFRDLDRLGVHPNLIRAITDDMGYEEMTPVQAKTIVPALKGSDIVAQAKTGTGKTLAFLLPLFQRMLDEDPSLVKRKSSYSARADDIRGIVISPTRELAEQIAVEAENLAKHTGLVVQVAVGGTDKRSMLRKTQREGCHLLVATPGRLNDLLRDETSGVDAPKLAAMVLDEADRILDVGFEQQLYDIQQCLPNVREKVRQTMLVSATIPEDVIRLARKMVRADDFEFVQTIGENESLTHDRVPQHVVSISSWANMFPTLFELIDRESARVPNFKAIIYFNTTAMTELGTLLTMQRRRSRISPLFVWGINSRMTQMGRQRAADQFRTAQSGILVSSDVTARGMDFPNVTHVIQVDVPQERESYIHRVGRTARQGKDGQAWLLLPSLSAGPARRLLGGLPLQPNNTLSEVADVRVDGSAELPPIFEQVKELVPLVRSEAFQPAYSSMFGGAKADKNAVARDLNNMFTAGLGFERPPPMSPLLARKLGISPELLNTEQSVPASRGSRGGDRPSRGSFSDDRGDRGSSGGDAFDRMRSSIRSDRPNNYGRQDGRRDRPGGNFRRHDRTDRNNDRNDRYRSNRGRGDSRPSSL